MEFRHDSSVTEQKLESASVRRYVHDPMFIRFDRTRGFATGRRTDKRAETTTFTAQGWRRAVKIFDR